MARQRAHCYASPALFRAQQSAIRSNEFESAKLSAKLVKNSVLKIYPGGSHSLGDTSKEQLNKDLLQFTKA